MERELPKLLVSLCIFQMWGVGRGNKLHYKMARLILFRNKGPGIWLTRVLRFPRLSPATDMETEREKYFPGEALAGLLDTES